MLRQQYLIAKHGLAFPQQSSYAPDVPTQTGHILPATVEPAAGSVDQELREQILDTTLLRKQLAKHDYQDYVLFDIAFNPKGLDKPARAIKGVLIFTDLFGEQKFALRWTIENTVTLGAVYTEKGSGFEYNKFIDSHQWVRNTEKDNMKVKFRVDNILYQDGTSRSFD